MDVLFTASLGIIDRPNDRPASRVVVRVGSGVSADVSTSFTRRWQGSTASARAPSGVSEAQELDFVCEVQAHSDIWAVAGRRRVHFSARGGEVCRFRVLLIPLKAGDFLLPTVSVRPYSRQHGQGHSQDQAATSGDAELGPGLPSCETDYLNRCETVSVISDIQSTTTNAAFEPARSGSGAGFGTLA